MSGTAVVPPPQRPYPRRPSEWVASPPRTDAELRVLLREALPSNALEHAPARALFGVLHCALALGGMSYLTLGSGPWWATAAVVCLVANAWASLWWTAQEIAHGAVLDAPRVQRAFLTLAGLPFLSPARLWHAKHLVAHHGNPNMPDPDARFMPMQPALAPLRRLAGLFFHQTVSVQRALWARDRAHAFPRFAHWRARFESVLIGACWFLLAQAIGWSSALTAILLPILGANLLLGLYHVTQHSLRQHVRGAGTLQTGMSVSLPRLLERLHFHAGYHVEHHLFPRMASCHYPLVREWLLENEPERYLATSWPRAFGTWILLTRTPDGSWLGPLGARRFSSRELETRLRQSAVQASWKTSRAPQTAL